MRATTNGNRIRATMRYLPMTSAFLLASLVSACDQAEDPKKQPVVDKPETPVSEPAAEPTPPARAPSEEPMDETPKVEAPTDEPSTEDPPAVEEPVVEKDPTSTPDAPGSSDEVTPPQ